MRVVVPGCLALLSFVPCAAARAAIRFEERAQASGITLRTTTGDPEHRYLIETIGAGAALFDYDNDGDLDLYVVNGSQLEPFPPGKEPVAALYQNRGTGQFVDVTAGSGLAQAFWGFGVATGDYDNDGDPDLYVTAWGPNRLFRNNGDGTFKEVGHEAGVDVSRWGSSAAFLDYDADGALDLYVVNYVTFDPAVIPPKGDPNRPCKFRGLTVLCGPHRLPGAVDVLYHNNGDGTFTDVSEAAGLFTDGGYFGLGVVTTDIDSDGRQDILVANDSTPNFYYHNDGEGHFTDEALMAGFAYSNDGREQAGMGIDAGDIDGDGDFDLYVTNFSHDYSTLRLNDSGRYLEDVTVRVGLVEPTVSSLGWGTLLCDFDQDGDLDIFHANGHVYPEVDRADIGTSYLQANQVFENLGGLRFKQIEDVRGTGLEGKGLHRGTAGGDIDGDGDIDLVVTALNSVPKLLINQSSGGGWLQVKLIGHQSNRDGVGARVTVRAAGKTWVGERMGGRSYLSASDPRVHFGLGDVPKIDSVEVRWPSGVVQTVQNPPIRAVLTIEEPSGIPNGGNSGKSSSQKTDPP